MVALAGTAVGWTAADGPGHSNVFAKGTAESGSFEFTGQCYGRGGNTIWITVIYGPATTTAVMDTNCPD